MFAAFVFLTVVILYPAHADTVKPTFVTGSIAEPATLLPALASDNASHQVIGKIFNGLVRYNPDLELEPDLAESWTIADEGRVITFRLKKGVTWHDGTPFTSADVRFTYEVMIDPQTPTPYSGDFKKVVSLEVPDDYTVVITYDEPFAPALASWALWMMPRHLLEGKSLITAEFSRQPVGTGPYRFRRWITGQYVELRAFEDYYEGEPEIERVIYRVIPDQTTMFLELHQQTVDSMGLTPLQYSRLTDTPYFDQTFRKFRYASFGYTYIGLNLARQPFNDIRVRKALDYAINKQEIIDAVLYGLGRPLTGPFSPDSWAYNPDISAREFNPDESLRLLSDAGYSMNDRGMMERNGKTFEFTLITNQGNFQRKLAAEIIQRRLREIGISMNIKVVEWSAFLSEYIDKKKFDAVLLAWGLSRDPDIFDIWHSSKTEEGEFNFVSYNDPVADGLMVEGRAVFGESERKQIYHKLHRQIHEQSPYLFLYVADALPIVHSRFRGVNVTPLGVGYDFIRWHVSPDDRLYRIRRKSD